jgi:hypothetical protein
MAVAHDLDSALGVLDDVGTAARRATDLLGEVPNLLGAGRDILATERRAVLADLDGQRAQTLEYMTAERLAVLVAVHAERMALVSALRQERLETLVEVDAIKTRAVDSAMAGFKDLVDYTLWRVATMTFCLMLAAATLWVIAGRLAVGRRRGAVTS